MNSGRRNLEWPATPLSTNSAAETARRNVAMRDEYRAVVRGGVSAPGTSAVVELLGSVIVGGGAVKVKDEAGAAIEVTHAQLPAMALANVAGLAEVWWRTKTTEAGDDVLIDEVAR